MEIIKKSSILVSQSLSSKEEATSLSGKLLVENGYAEDGYVESMLEKLEKESYATYIGNGVAIPHGMENGKKWPY
jgi:PTS system mannitol-specific IIA component